MAKALGQPRPEMRETVPRVTTIQIPTDKIGAVIGTGGKTIREITERTGTKIDIERRRHGQDRLHRRHGEPARGRLDPRPDGHARRSAAIYEGKVARIVDFGAFVNFLGNQDGLCHISELANERVGKVTDVVKEGDMVKVKVLAIDDRGKIKLSMRAVDQADRRGAARPAPAAARRPRGWRRPAWRGRSPSRRRRRWRAPRRRRPPAARVPPPRARAGRLRRRGH